MPSNLVTRMIAEAGPRGLYRHTLTEELEVAVKLTSGKFTSVHKMQPWQGAEGILDHHPVGFWDNLRVVIIPSGAVYGRIINFFGAWGVEGQRPPTSPAEFAKLRGSVVLTYGGTGSIEGLNQTLACPFNNTVTELMKGPGGDGQRAVFFYAFVETMVIDKPANGARLILELEGEFDVAGQY